MISLTSLPSTPVGPWGQQMSTPLNVLLKADPGLEGDKVNDKADPSVCLQLNQISVLQSFLETAGSMNHQLVLRQDVFF